MDFTVESAKTLRKRHSEEPSEEPSKELDEYRVKGPVVAIGEPVESVAPTPNNFHVRLSSSERDRAAQLELRYRVLREPLGMSRQEAIFVRDDDADTVHLLAIEEQRASDVDDVIDRLEPTVIGTATMITHGPDVVQLRGMATDPAWRGHGVGRAILEVAHTMAGARSLWCDARISAHDFYARMGWVAEGSVFDIPNVGPHTVMRYRPRTAKDPTNRPESNCTNPAGLSGDRI